MVVVSLLESPEKDDFNGFQKYVFLLLRERENNPLGIMFCFSGSPDANY